MVRKVWKLAFRRILRFVISSFLEGVMTILLPKGQRRFFMRAASADVLTSRIKMYHLRRN